MGRAMLSKSLIQFSVDGQGCFPSLLFDLRPKYGGGNDTRFLCVCAFQESVFPILCSSGYSMVELTVTSSKRAYAVPKSATPRAPAPRNRPLLTRTSSGDTQIQFWLSLCGVSGSWSTQGLFEPSKHLWWVWGLILNVISLLLPFCWGFSFALGYGVSFFGGIQ